MLSQLNRAFRKAAKRTAPLLAVGLVFAALGAFASNASANEIGRCASHHVDTGLELYQSWKTEEVVSLAPANAKSAGYREIDGDLKSWMKERVVKMKTAEEAEFKDYGCHPGEIFGAGTIAFPKGTSILAALPAKYDIQEYCGVKAHKGCEKVVVTACSVGKVNCSNPLENCAGMYFYVKIQKQPVHRKRHHHHKKHHRHHKKEVVCKSGTVKIGNGCSPQTNNAELECAKRGSGWKWEGIVVGCVQVQQNGVCSAQSGVVNGNNNSVDQAVTCCIATGSCTTSPPTEEKPPVVPPVVPPTETCTAGYIKNANGVCVKQENKAEQTCQVNIQGTWNSVEHVCEITQINGNCSTIVVLKEVYVEGNLEINIENETCVVKEEKHEPPPEEVCKDHSATNYGGPLPCKYEEPPSILITSTTQLNQIPVGKNSGPFHVGVSASKAGGTLTIDPGIGSVSACGSSTEKESLTVSVPAGASEQCVIIYAPEDGDKPEWMEVTETAVLGSAHDQKTQKLKITYPQRPE